MDKKMEITGGLYMDYYKDPFLHSKLSKSKSGVHKVLGWQGIRISYLDPKGGGSKALQTATKKTDHVCTNFGWVQVFQVVLWLRICRVHRAWRGRWFADGGF